MQSAFESIQSAAVRREYQEAVAEGNKQLAGRIRFANPDLFPPRVLVTVKGGIAEVYQDSGIRVLVVDYDNEPDAIIPEEFRGPYRVPALKGENNQ